MKTIIKTLLLTTAFFSIGTVAYAQWCKEVVKCDASGCRQILDCR